MIKTVKKVYDFISNEHSSYEMTKDNKTSFVPLDEANSDYQAIMEYIENGGEVIDNGGNN